jgi:pseudouridine-5'-phosphate glycosidase
MLPLSHNFLFSPDVARALREGRPVVALESTIISHGMPYPQNIQTALEVEGVVSQHGAVPATIAIIGGKPCIGLTRDQLEHIARAGPGLRKVSRRDLPLVLAKGLDGATTVSATMILAAKSGIHVFVTGGIGGVHRGGEYSMDISADLTELARTPVAVICAGAKSADEFPAFFTRSSGCKAPCRADSPLEVACMMHSSQHLQLAMGMVVAVPIPSEAEAEGQVVEEATQRALREAEQDRISGSAVTPFLLERIRALSEGKSLDANIKLIKNNARIGAYVAVAFSSIASSNRELTISSKL